VAETMSLPRTLLGVHRKHKEKEYRGTRVADVPFALIHGPTWMDPAKVPLYGVRAYTSHPNPHAPNQSRHIS
jgi:hypothetical protein